MNCDFIRKPDYLCVTGSRLYGAERYDEQGNCLSDIDYRGFVLPPVDYLLGFYNFKQGDLEGDHQIYSMARFIEMLFNGNFQALECLFAPDSHVKTMTEEGAAIRNMRQAFVSKHYYKAITGFAYSEWRKVRCVKIEMPKRTKTEDEVIQDMLNKFGHLPKDTKDQIIELLFSEHEKKEVPSTASLGSKRKAEREKYGYCVSSASHAIRMLSQCIELMSTANITFPRPERSLLQQIKRGEIPFHDLESMYADLGRQADEVHAQSALPDKPNRERVHKAYQEIVKRKVSEHLCR